MLLCSCGESVPHLRAQLGLTTCTDCAVQERKQDISRQMIDGKPSTRLVTPTKKSVEFEQSFEEPKTYQVVHRNKVIAQFDKARDAKRYRNALPHEAKIIWRWGSLSGIVTHQMLY